MTGCLSGGEKATRSPTDEDDLSKVGGLRCPVRLQPHRLEGRRMATLVQSSDRLSTTNQLH